jgi:hypothetical protein
MFGLLILFAGNPAPVPHVSWYMTEQECIQAAPVQQLRYMWRGYTISQVSCRHYALPARWNTPLFLENK